MNGCEFCGYANRTAGKTLHIVEETEPRIFIGMHGSGYGNSAEDWLDWLKQEADDEA